MKDTVCAAASAVWKSRIAVSSAFMEKILLDLGFGLDGDTILVPSWRGDVEHYSDIAEEVARFYGYNNIPIRFSGGNTRCGGYTEIQEAERLAGVLCRSFGMMASSCCSENSSNCPKRGLSLMS